MDSGFLLLPLVRVSGSDRIVVGLLLFVARAALAKRLQDYAGMSVDEAVRSVQAPWNKGHGPLHMAAALGKLKACKYLIKDLGLDVNATGTDGSYPSFYFFFCMTFVGSALGEMG